MSFSSVQTYLASKVTNSINKEYGTEIFIEKVDLSSLRNIDLKQVLIKDHHNDTVIFVNNASTSLLNYRNLFKNNIELGSIELEDGFFRMITYKGEESNNFTHFMDSFKKDPSSDSKPFELTTASIHLENIDYELFDENKQEEILIFYRDITGFFDEFEIKDKVFKANIHDLSTIQNNGIEIVSFQGEFLYSATRMELYNTNLQTENSKIDADIVFNYEEGDFSDFNSKVMIDADFYRADLSLIDLQKLYGEFGRNDTFHLSTHFIGTINDFVLNDIVLVSDRYSSLKGTVNIKNSFEREHFYLHADLLDITSSYDHLKNLLPKLLGEKLPQSIKKLGNFSSSGIIVLNENNIETKLKTNSKLGQINTELELSEIDNLDNAKYKGKLELIDFKLGDFVRDTLIGELSMVGEIEGQGFSIDLLNTTVKGEVSKHQYKGYTYSGIYINGVFMNKHFNGLINVDDPNIKMDFLGLADFSTELYKFDFNADVVYANFNKLNLYKQHEKSILKGRVDLDFTGNSFDNLIGEISFKEAAYTNENDDYYFKNFNITSSFKDTVRIVEINSSDIVKGKIVGNFKYKDLLKLAKNAAGSVFVNYQREPVSEGQYIDFKFEIHNKIVEVFYPDVELGSNTFFRGKIDSDREEIRLLLKSPRIEAYENIIENVDLQIDNRNPLYSSILSIDKIDLKKYNASKFNLVSVSLKDTLFIRTDFDGGKESTEHFDLSLYHTINSDNQSVFGIKKSQIHFKENDWIINENENHYNKIVFDDDYKTFAIDNIDIVSGDQKMDVAGAFHGNDNKNIDLKMQNVNLNDITPNIDSIYIDGKVNGSISLQKVENKTLPIADLTINYFSINHTYYGDLSLNASGDETIKNYNFEAQLLNNDLKTFYTTGNVNFNYEKAQINAELSFNKFNIGAFSPLGKDVLKNIRGIADGEVDITGDFRNPDIDGEIRLSNAGLALPYLNVDYDFSDDTTILLYDQTFDFQTIEISDVSENTKGEISGTITHEEFKSWELDLLVKTDNLLILDTEDYEGALYYGTGYIKGSTTLKGPVDDLEIIVIGTTNPGTEFIIPLSYVSTVGESNLIHFYDPNAVVEEEKTQEDIIFDRLKGLTLVFILNVTKDAVAEVVIDKQTGSILRGSGDGNLRLNIDANGKFEMFGELVIDNGEYKFKNIVNKDFDVQKGGNIIWNGNPYDAELNIAAVNHTKANPAVLLDEIKSTRKIDVDLVTTITGSLSQAQFDFDIDIPNSSSIVSTELDFKLSDEDEEMRQFFSLLVTGSFLDLNNRNSEFNSNAVIAGTIAEQASSILSQALKSSNEDFQVGVSYETGVQNKVEDVNTDDQLGILVSGRIGNKVIVNGKVGVPVGSNTTSSVVGEVEVIVPLNEQETLLGKVYNRQNEIQFDISESEGYTQGVGISYLINFDDGNEFLEKVGLKKTEAQKMLTKEQRDSIKKENKLIKQEKKQEKKESNVK